MKIISYKDTCNNNHSIIAYLTMAQVNTVTATDSVPTIATILRDKDLEFKKVNKDAINFIGVEAIVDQSKVSKELTQTGQTFQSVYDKLGHITKKLSELKRANVSTLTEAKNFFTQKEMNVIDSRQNMVGKENVGVKSEVFYLRQLYNHAVQQANQVKAHMDSHNNTMKAKLEKDLKSEDTYHEAERKKLKERKMAIPDDFESAYANKVKSVTQTFWQENKATQVDPLNIFLFLAELKTWLDDHEKHREIRLNRAIHGAIGTFVPFETTTETNTVSLEELMSYVKDYNYKIETAFHKLVLVSWRVGTKDPYTHDVTHAEDRLNEIKTLIRTYGEMQSVQKVITSTVLIGVQNPITNEPMTAADVVDFKHAVVPVLTKMLARVEQQQKEAKDMIKVKEPECRNKVMELLKDTMGAASGRPSPEQMKEITKGLMESLMPKLIMGEGLEVWLGKYQTVLDHVESTMDTALATVNANTRVPVTWTNVTTMAEVGSWDSSAPMITMAQPTVTAQNGSSHATSTW